MRISKKRASRTAMAALLWCAVFTAPATAAYTFTWSQPGGPRQASVTFALSNSEMTVTLENTATADVMAPDEVLTAVFFDVAAGGNSVWTPVSAEIGAGGTIWFDQYYEELVPGSHPKQYTQVPLFDANKNLVQRNVGGEWAYGTGVFPPAVGPSRGISSTGLNLFGDPNFNGPDLETPEAVDGLNYGITSNGDNPSLGNSAVTGQFPLIFGPVVFKFAVTNPGQLAGDNYGISNVVFQYGTNLSEFSSRPPNEVPEPTTIIALLGMTLTGVGATAARRIRRN